MHCFRLFRAVLPAFALVGASPATAAPDPQWPVAMRGALGRLGEIEWRLGQRALSSCPTTAAGTGFVFDHRAAYRREDWPLLAATLGLGERPVIAAVVPGSPAALAGALPGDTVVAIAGEPVERIIAAGEAERLAADSLAEFVARQAPGSPIRVEIERGGAPMTLDVTAVPQCGARVILATSNAIDAHSDGRNVSVSSGLLNFARSDDEIALLAGHELAHVIHRDGKARDLAERRAMEDAADLLGAHLARCAGYDAGGALDFWERYARRDMLSFLRSPSHRNPRERIRRMRAFLETDSC